MGTDRDVLRALAEETAALAALPEQEETRRLWRELNGLRMERPLVMIDQIPWHEMAVGDELTPRCQDPLCRQIETGLRRQLYKWRHLRHDLVIEPFVDVPRAIHGTGFGIATQEERAVTDPGNDVVGHRYFDQLRTDDDLQKIRLEELGEDVAETERRRAHFEEIFDGLLAVRMQGALPVFAAWDRLVTWRSPEAVLTDLAERPDFVHRLMQRYTEVALEQLDRLEQGGLLGCGQTTIHCTGAYADELPAAGFDPTRPRARDLWTYGMAQIFSAVSPAMHKEFWLDYAVRWFERFGLGYYGCCEPLHHKVDLIRQLPAVRKISISPFADVDAGAEAIGGDYVLSRKPSPALLAMATWDPDAVERELRQTLEACARNGCAVELILKDISTVRYEPQRLWEWARLARDLVEGGRIVTASGSPAHGPHQDRGRGCER
jgi:hypothetical protein